RLLSARLVYIFFFSSRRRHTRLVSDWSSDVCSSDLLLRQHLPERAEIRPHADPRQLPARVRSLPARPYRHARRGRLVRPHPDRKIGRASCRERVEISGDGEALKEKRRREEKDVGT